MEMQFYQVSLNARISNMDETEGEIRIQVMQKFSHNIYNNIS